MKTTFLTLALLLSQFICSYSQFKLSGELRPRFEYNHGYKSLANENQDASAFTSQRSRLLFEYKDDNLLFSITLQDVRMWGSQKQLATNEDFATSIHEAWAEVLFTKKISLKAGRQELSYDDQRILGGVDWLQQARAHDVAIFKYTGKLNAHLGFAFHQSGTITNNFYTGPDSYKSMQFVWLNKKTDKLNISLLFLNNGAPYTKTKDTLGNMTEQGVRYSQTLGPRIVYSKNKISTSFNFYYQMGKTSANKTINSYEGAMELGYKISDKLGINLGFERLSGTSQTDTANKEDNSFNPLYGTNHKFNGTMDYFYVSNHIGSVGLNDIYLKLAYSKNKISASLTAHNFTSASDILDKKEFVNNGKITAMSSSLGNEIDLDFGYSISKSITFKAGYSHMFGTESLVALKGGKKEEISNWAWLMLVVKPTFFDPTSK
ncbi:MAG: alginate export family protein [Bacteroidia bacterium]|nr:alginate export family protein [Bacteroidia bacterium]